MEHTIQVYPKLVPSQEDQADYWSRVPRDKGDYKMDRELFLLLKRKLRKWVNPSIDMFASPGNHQLKSFVSRYPHWEANRQDALNCHLNDISQCYANPRGPL